MYHLRNWQAIGHRVSTPTVPGPNSTAGFFMGGRSQVPETDTDTRALFAYEGRRLAQLDYSAADYWLILLDYSAAGSHANVAGQPTAKGFRLSAFNWDNRYTAPGFHDFRLKNVDFRLKNVDFIMKTERRSVSFGVVGVPRRVQGEQ